MNAPDWAEPLALIAHLRLIWPNLAPARPEVAEWLGRLRGELGTIERELQAAVPADSARWREAVAGAAERLSGLLRIPLHRTAGDWQLVCGMGGALGLLAVAAAGLHHRSAARVETMLRETCALASSADWSRDPRPAVSVSAP